VRLADRDEVGGDEPAGDEDLVVSAAVEVVCRASGGLAPAACTADVPIGNDIHSIAIDEIPNACDGLRRTDLACESRAARHDVVGFGGAQHQVRDLPYERALALRDRGIVILAAAATGGGANRE
jgi:hypothetical protein